MAELKFLGELFLKCNFYFLQENISIHGAEHSTQAYTMKMSVLCDSSV